MARPPSRPSPHGLHLTAILALLFLQTATAAPATTTASTASTASTAPTATTSKATTSKATSRRATATSFTFQITIPPRLLPPTPASPSPPTPSPAAAREPVSGPALTPGPAAPPVVLVTEWETEVETTDVTEYEYVTVRASRPAAGAVDGVRAYGQCGGRDYGGATECAEGLACSTMNDYYAQCL